MGRSYNHWTEAEVAALKEGVVRFGVGNWQKIVNDYPVLRQRTGVQLKDKARRMARFAGAGCKLCGHAGCEVPAGCLARAGVAGALAGLSKVLLTVHPLQYRNMIKFRHLGTNDLAAEVPPPRRRSSGRQRSPAVSAGGPATSDGGAAASQQQLAAPPAVPPQPQPPPLPPSAQAARTTSQSAVSLSPAQRQAQVAAQQAAAQTRLQAAQAALQQARAAYIQQLAAASVRRGAAAAAAEEAADAEQRLGPPSPQVQGLQHVAKWWQQQAALAQQLLLATRQMYLQAAEEAQGAQAAANAAAAAMLQAAECLADSQAPRGALPTVSGGGASDHALPVRHSNRRKAALNRKRFLGVCAPLPSRAAWPAAGLARWRPATPGFDPNPGVARAVGWRASAPGRRPSMGLPFCATLRCSLPRFVAHSAALCCAVLCPVCR